MTRKNLLILVMLVSGRSWMQPGQSKIIYLSKEEKLLKKQKKQWESNSNSQILRAIQVQLIVVANLKVSPFSFCLFIDDSRNSW